MKLREQIKCAVINPIRNNEDKSEWIEKISDDFAIEFGNWLNNKVVNPYATHHNLLGSAKVSQLLIIFKQEKGL